MRTYTPEELIKLPLECTCGKTMSMLAPMRARNNEMLLIAVCANCNTKTAIQLNVVDKVPDHIVETFLEAIHQEDLNVKKEDIPSKVDGS